MSTDSSPSNANADHSPSVADDLDVFCRLANLDAAVLMELLPSPASLHTEPIEPRCRDAHLPTARTVVHLMVGHQDEGLEAIVSLLADGRIEVAEFAVRWEGHSPVVRRRLDVAVVVEVTPDPVERSAAVAAAVTSVRRRRRKRFHRCSRCRALTPPEWWSGDGHCQACAQRYLGVVY